MIEQSSTIRYFTGHDRPVTVFQQTSEIFDIHTAASNQSWICGANAFVAYTNNNGYGWNTIDLNAKCGWVGNVNVIFKAWGWFPNTIKVWGANNQCAYSSDEGVTWTREDTTFSAGQVISDVRYTGGYLFGCGSNGLLAGPSVGGSFGSGGTSVNSPNYFACAKNPIDVTQIRAGYEIGGSIYIDIFGWPPPASHYVNTYVNKNSTANTIGAVFDNANNLFLLESNKNIIKWNSPGYPSLPPAGTAAFSSASVLDPQKWLAIDESNYIDMAVCGQDNANSEGAIWISNTTNAPSSWTKYTVSSIYQYTSDKPSIFNKVERGYSYNTWNAVGKTTSGKGCFTRFKV